MVAALACFGALLVAPGSASASIETLAFTPVADTYVDASAPSSSFGSSSSMYDDASPTKQSFLRFNLSGLEGRPVLDARLRLNNKDSSPQGGRVWSISSNSWAEGVTWSSRPAIDGPLLGAFGAVQSGTWYEVDLGAGSRAAMGPPRWRSTRSAATERSGGRARARTHRGCSSTWRWARRSATA